MLVVSHADLEVKNGVVTVRGVPPEARSVTVGEVATQALFRPEGRPISAMGGWDPPSTDLDKDWYGNESGAYNFCAQAVEVEVDPETGQFTILDMTMASDAGTVVHPMACEGQNEGALAQGLGYAHIEEPAIEGGRVLNPSLSDYRIPCVADMPPFKQVFVPSYEPTGPFGAKGVGQIGLDPTGPALANAIYQAVGVRIKSLPITPEKILRALGEKDRGGAV
jgi:CO/xanthine dehydrogenase Mo-binding subunit